MTIPKYVDQDDLDEEYQHLLEPANMGEIERVLNLFRMLANNPPLLRSFMLWSGTLWDEVELSGRQRELVILTVARELESEYEWNQHVPIAINCGIERDEIIDLANGTLEGFSDSEQVLIRYTEKACQRSVSHEDTEQLCEAFEDSTAVGVVVLVGNYVMTDFIIDILDIELDSPFVGWSIDST